MVAPNLAIRGDSLVDRVLLEGRRAIGVRTRTNGEWQDLLAAQVVLAAGAFHSPPILMRSGIGPAEHLRSHGIEVVEDLPVGAHVFDHPYVRIELKLKPELRPTDIDARHTNCCVKYSSGLGGGTDADMLMMAFNHGGVGGDLDPSMFGEAGIHCSLFEAFSRGQVRLASAEPTVDPIVELNMLDDERDLIRLRDGARRLVQIAIHPAVQGITREIQVGNTGRPLSRSSSARPTGLRRLAARRLLGGPARCGRLLHGSGRGQGRPQRRRPRRQGARHRRPARRRRLDHALRLQGQYLPHRHHDRRAHR